MASSSPAPLTPAVAPPAPPRRSDDSDSDSSQVTTRSVRRSPFAQQPSAGRPSAAAAATADVTTPQTFRQPPGRTTPASEPPAPPGPPPPPPPFPSLRTHSPAVDPLPQPQSHLGHRPRQRSQGYFEPSLPSNNATAMSANLSASQIAAQAAMHVQNTHHNRKRSQTIPEPGSAPGPGARRPPPVPAPVTTSATTTTTTTQSTPSTITFATNGVQYQNGLVGGHRVAAATAANAAFPRSPISPSVTTTAADHIQSPILSERDAKPFKEKSKMKLFSKPKNIGITKDKDFDRKHPALPSPGKISIHNSGALGRMMMNASTTSLVETTGSSAATLYSSANASTSTLVPSERSQPFIAPEKEKEKHKHHFLSRQKNKLRDDHHNLPLSSASSNSRPTDPNGPQPLYSFAAPSSPGHSSTFAQSMSGLDLRHGGRALRQKKKEEKAASLAPYMIDTLEPSYRERNTSFSTERSEWPGPGSLGMSPATSVGPSPGGAYSSDVAGLGSTFGIHGLTPDDAWPLLKARLLHIFEGEDPRPPIEDFNALLAIHIRRCVQKRAPTILIEDLNEFLQTGFLSLDQTLRHVPDERLITNLVEIWHAVFTTILPFLQAVFLPLDLEFKGRGANLTTKEAAEFWGAALPDEKDKDANKNIPTLGEELDVRRITLLTFRDTVILPRHDTLMQIFSRLSLENVQTGLPDAASAILGTGPGAQLPFGSADSSSSINMGSSNNTSILPQSSLSSTSTTQMDGGMPPLTHSTTNTSTYSNVNSRSRATSNTSAGSFQSVSHLHHPHGPSHGRFGSIGSHHQAAAGANSASIVTSTVARLLQCMSVLASVQSSDESQTKMDQLVGKLKYNWLARGRTGRQRWGFVGAKTGNRGGITGAGSIQVKS